MQFKCDLNAISIQFKYNYFLTFNINDKWIKNFKPFKIKIKVNEKIGILWKVFIILSSLLIIYIKKSLIDIKLN